MHHPPSGGRGMVASALMPNSTTPPESSNFKIYRKLAPSILSMQEDKGDLILKNLWYLAMPSSSLKRGRLVARTIARERIVFGRDAAGKAYALKDNCPHRGVPLSLGHLLENGNIQ